MKPLIYYSEMDSPIGPLTIFSTDKGVCNIDFGSLEEVWPAIKSWLQKVTIYNDFILSDKVIFPAKEQLEQFFNGNGENFDIPLDLFGTPFQLKVWEALRSIKYGETKSYKEIAQAIKAPKAVRAVGGAINRNPIPILIPCHRVIGSNGALVGYNGGLNKKITLLSIENSIAKIS